MRRSVSRYSLSVVLVGLVVLFGAMSAFAQDAYPPPEGPVEVLPTVIEQAPAPATESQPAVEAEGLPATGAGVTVAAIVALALVVGGGAVLTVTRRPRRDR